MPRPAFSSMIETGEADGFDTTEGQGGGSPNLTPWLLAFWLPFGPSSLQAPLPLWQALMTGGADYSSGRVRASAFT